MRGRIGNQMFQVAFAHATATRLKTSFALLGPYELPEHFENPPLRGDVHLLGAKLAFYARHGRAERLFFENDRAPAEVVAQLVNGKRYSGFFQSAEYFAGQEQAVRAMFAVRADHRAAFERAYGELGRYVCIHARRGDYAGSPWLLPARYFRDALAAAPGVAGLPIVVVSDQADAIRAGWGWLEEASYVSNAPAIDLLLLMHASVVITSNSSFSWWGAWLNQTAGRIVAAPASWLGVASGVEEPPGVVPADWIAVPVAATGTG